MDFVHGGLGRDHVLELKVAEVWVYRGLQIKPCNAPSAPCRASPRALTFWEVQGNRNPNIAVV